MDPCSLATLRRSQLELGDEIGRGAFSTVFRGTLVATDGAPPLLVAIKKLVVARRDLDRHLQSELELLGSPIMRHPNLIRYYGVAIESTGASYEFFIVTEFMDGGDLRSLLRSDYELPWRLRVRLARDIARALAHLHAAEVVHRDIKADNVLLDDSWRCVLADYGFARKARMGVAVAMTMCGTDEYMAPEILWGEQYDERADVFSFGCIAWALLARRVPGAGGFMVREARSKFKLDFDALRAGLPPGAPPSLVACATACCSYEPEGRPSAADVVEWLDDLLRELVAADAGVAAAGGGGEGASGGGGGCDHVPLGVPPPSVLIGRRPAGAAAGARSPDGRAAGRPLAAATPPAAAGVAGEAAVADAGGVAALPPPEALVAGSPAAAAREPG